VTVGRERDKVKPNGKKRSNLPAMPHPQPSDPDVRISRARSRRFRPWAALRTSAASCGQVLRTGSDDMMW